MESLLGQTLNRFQITNLLGEGGMGAVYKARDITLQRDVAVKVMHPQYTRQQNFQERFLQEARVAAKLDHPGIVKVFDFGEAKGMLYIVMELIPGENLRKMLQDLRNKKQWIVLDEGVTLVRQVALALAYAHRQGVLHRDMKPDNIMLKPEPADGLPFRPVITDLGLAKLASGGVMTQDGTSMGTPAYMSPEQALGEKTDACSDVYSLGILLYELAVGRLPFPATTLSEALRYHVKEPPPDPRSIRPDLPEPLAKAILKAIQKKPGDRFPNADAFAQALAPGLTPSAGSPVQSSLANQVSLVTQLQKGIVEPRGPSLAQEFKKAPDNLTRDRIQIVEQDQTGKSVQIKAGGMTIGRDDDNDIVLNETKVSRHHAKIDFDGSNYRVSDLNSTNGTFLAGTRLLPGIPEIWPDDQFLQVGDAYMRLERASGAAPSSATQGNRMASGAGRVLSNGTSVDTNQIKSSSGDGLVGIFTDPAPQTVAPGSAVTSTLLILNQGPVVDQIKLSLSGIPAEWITLPSPVVQLMPGDQKEVTVNIHPPQNSQSKAGRYQVAYRATSQVAPNQTAEIRSSLTVKPYTRFTTEMRPQRVRSGQPARITITNQGNLQENFQVAWEDRGNEVNFTPPQYKLSVSEGQSAVVEFRAVPKERALVGGEKITPFSARIGTADIDPQVQSGELVSRALIPPWVIAIIPVLLACLVGAGLFGYFQITGQQARQTQTAEAFVQQAQATHSAISTQVILAMIIQTQSASGTKVSEQSLQTEQVIVKALTQVAVVQTQTAVAFKSPTLPPSATVPASMTPTPTLTPTITSTPVPPGAWQGNWQSTCELLTCSILKLDQTGNNVTGTYGAGDGHLTGTVDGRRLNGTWTLGGANGTFDLWLSLDGKTWQGNWNKTFDWCGSRDATMPSPCGLASWYGDWITSCGDSGCSNMTLIQNGSDIVGTYAGGGGTIKAAVNSTTLNGSWNRNGTSGSFIFFMQPEGTQFNGNFDSSFAWCGNRSGAALPGTCLATVKADTSKFNNMFISTFVPVLPKKFKFFLIPTPTP